MRNVGSEDKGFRSVLGLILTIVVFMNGFVGFWTVIAFFVALIMLITSWANWCPLYAILGMRTCPRKEPKETKGKVEKTAEQPSSQDRKVSLA